MVFSLVFRYQPVDIIQPTNHVLPASFGDSDWYFVTGISLTSTNESSRRKPPQHDLQKQGMPGEYLTLSSTSLWNSQADVPLCLFFSLSLSSRSRAAQTRAEQPVFGSEFGPGRCLSWPGAAAESGVSPAPTHASAPTHPPAHIHSFSIQLTPDAAHAALCTSHGAYPSPKCEDK